MIFDDQMLQKFKDFDAYRFYNKIALNVSLFCIWNRKSLITSLIKTGLEGVLVQAGNTVVTSWPMFRAQEFSSKKCQRIKVCRIKVKGGGGEQVAGWLGVPLSGLSQDPAVTHCTYQPLLTTPATTHRTYQGTVTFFIQTFFIRNKVYT